MRRSGDDFVGARGSRHPLDGGRKRNDRFPHERIATCGKESGNGRKVGRWGDGKEGGNGRKDKDL